MWKSVNITTYDFMAKYLNCIYINNKSRVLFKNLLPFTFIMILSQRDECMKFWHRFQNKTLPSFFKSFFKYNHEMHDNNTRNRNSLHLFPTRTEGAKMY